tara:strand:+ start:150 stop:443 length:294 start_codon:yes stop_codon:yes gene_type:complete
MKILEWKSFAIGVLLTTTVVFSTGASNKPTNKNLLEKIEILSWDKNQQWEFKTSNTKNIPKDGNPLLTIVTIILIHFSYVAASSSRFKLVYPISIQT